MAAGVAAFPSAYNVYVPDTEATGNLRVEFSRNEKKFPLNQYIQIVPVKATTGLYWEATNEEAGRVLTDALHAWPDGAPSPTGAGQTESFRTLDYRCTRYAYPVTLGDMTIEQASWDISASHLRIEMQKAMTLRTRQALSILTTSGNYASTHTSTVASICGSNETWATATSSNKNIQKSIHTALNVIEADTLSAVDVNDFVLVISPALALKMAASGEIADYLKSSPYASPVLKGDWAGPDTRGLPERLYGVKVVIENSAQTTSRRGATAAKSYIMGNASAALIARPGSLEGVNGPNYSTVTMFSYEDMVTEKLNDAVNRRTLIRVTDNFDMKITAPVSGYLFTTCQ